MTSSSRRVRNQRRRISWRSSPIESTATNRPTAPTGGLSDDRLPAFSRTSCTTIQIDPTTSSSEPAPGHCAWLDRAISRDEPSSLAYAPGAGQDFSFTFKGDKWTLADTEDDGLKHILNKIRRGELFYLRCHREAGFLKVDHVGP